MSQTKPSKFSVKNGTPARLFLSLDDDGNDVPKTNIHHDPTLEQIFEYYEVDSVEGLADALLSYSGGYYTQTEARLGIVDTYSDENEFYPEPELLASVDGISEEIAEGLLGRFADIPTICEEYRRGGDVFLGEVIHNAQVEDREWASGLEALAEEMGHGDPLESRMKSAGVWVEPDNVTA